MLLGFYRVQVELRQMRFIHDQYTNQTLQAMAEILTRADCQKFGIMLSGLFGNGKTTMLRALAAAISCLDCHGMIDHSGFDGAADMTIYSARHIAQVARSDNPQAFDGICRCGLLAIDDLGTEPAEVVNYGNVCNPVTELLEYRYDKRLPTIVSTNLTPPTIKERYGERLGDRLREMMDNIVFEAASYR